LLPEYRVFETDNFKENIEAISAGNPDRMQKKLGQFVYPRLRQEPHYGPNIKKLKNWQPDTWRYRVGNWRFFYEIDENEKVVLMIAAYHRKEAYR